MLLPSSLLSSLEGVRGFDKEAFEEVHASPERVTSVRINPLKPITQLTSKPINQLTKIPWTSNGYYLDHRPSFTFDPLFHAGCYYVQEASSMFLEQALKQTVDLSSPLKILDLCAAPGGKSTHIQSLISRESILVSNEVIRSRVNILKGNIIKWGCENVVVTHNDPKDFARLENYFDVIVVDAPCSGSGLFRRDNEAIKEWSENHVQLCTQRQQRILADVWPALKKGGTLIYSTCSYSKEEDEEIVQWIKDNFPAENILLDAEKDWRLVDSEGAYRFWPDKTKGEGFFIAALKKREGDSQMSFKTRSGPEKTNNKETAIIGKWISGQGKSFIKYKNTVYAWPDIHSNDFNMLLDRLRVIYSGALAGELVRDKLVPHHALAMSKLLPESIIRTPLDREQSVIYLQRKDISVLPQNKGWQLVTYEGHPLGWVNVLSNRINNYYPKELRIIKDI